MCHYNKSLSYVNTYVTFVIITTDTVHKTFGLVCTLITWLQERIQECVVNLNENPNSN